MASSRFCLLGFAFAIILVGCSGGADTSTSSSTTTTVGSSSSTGNGGAGAGGGGATSSSSGFTTSSSVSSGTGGAPPMAGAPGQETVSAGQLCKSPSYRMIMTLGQPTQNQGLTTSPGYQMRGGLIGATQK